MEHFMEYWFMKYDNESFEREFSKVSYMDILSQLMIHPDFVNLPNNPPISNDPSVGPLERCVEGVLNTLIKFFCDLNLDEGLTDPFSRYGRTVLAFLDCEKLYGIIFWNLNFIPLFVECRVNASIIRFYKLFISFCQAILTPDGVQQQQNISNDGGRRMNIIIKRVIETNPRNGIYLDWKRVQRLQRDILDVLKLVQSHTPTMVGKLYYFVANMFEKSINDLKKICDQQFGNIESQQIQKILTQNNIALKHIDNYIEASEKNLVDDFNEDQEMFDNSEALRDLVSNTELSYLPNDLKTRIYGVQGEPQGKEQREKDQRKLIYEKLQKKAQRDRQRQEKVDQNYMEKFRQERELVTAGTMVTQESGDTDFRPRKIRSQLVNEISAEGMEKQKEQVLQSRLTKFTESETYKNSPNNPQIMKGSVVAYLANDIFQPYYEQEEKKKKREQEQQDRINKKNGVSTSSIAGTTSIVAGKSQANLDLSNNLMQSTISSTRASTNALSSKATIDSKIEESLQDDLIEYLRRADASLVEIKDEDIAIEEGNKKRRYRIKKRKNPNPNDSLNSQQEFDSPDVRKPTNNHSSTSEVFEEDAKRLAAKKLLHEQHQVMLSQLRVSHIQEKPSDEVKDTELFQYSYENSLDEDDMEEEDEKQKRMVRYLEKVPMPMNPAHASDGILFEKLKEWVGDKETSNIRRVKILQGLFKILPKRLTISSKTAIPANQKWPLLIQMMNQKEIDKRVADVVGMDFEDEYAFKASNLPHYLHPKQCMNRMGQIF